MSERFECFRLLDNFTYQLSIHVLDSRLSPQIAKRNPLKGARQNNCISICYGAKASCLSEVNQSAVIIGQRKKAPQSWAAIYRLRLRVVSGPGNRDDS